MCDDADISEFVAIAPVSEVPCDIVPSSLQAGVQCNAMQCCQMMLCAPHARWWVASSFFEECTRAFANLTVAIDNRAPKQLPNPPFQIIRRWCPAEENRFASVAKQTLPLPLLHHGRPCVLVGKLSFAAHGVSGSVATGIINIINSSSSSSSLAQLGVEFLQVCEPKDWRRTEMRRSQHLHIIMKCAKVARPQPNLPTFH